MIQMKPALEATINCREDWRRLIDKLVDWINQNSFLRNGNVIDI